MKTFKTIPIRLVLALPAFMLHPLTTVVIAVVHVYLAAGHLLQLIIGDVKWTHVWKGSGALAGAYVFAVPASRKLASGRRLHLDPDGRGTRQEFGRSSA